MSVAPKERLFEWLLDGVLQAIVDDEGEMKCKGNAIKELWEIRQCSDKQDTLLCFWNALTHEADYLDDMYWKNKKGKFIQHNPMLGWEGTLEIFKPFIEKYPDITKVLTIYMYS